MKAITAICGTLLWQAWCCAQVLTPVEFAWEHERPADAPPGAWYSYKLYVFRWPQTNMAVTNVTTTNNNARLALPGGVYGVWVTATEEPTGIESPPSNTLRFQLLQIRDQAYIRTTTRTTDEVVRITLPRSGTNR